MAVILLGISMSVLDGTIVNLALPGIVRDLHAQAATAVWIVTAYQVATLVLLLPCAMLGDLLGQRRVYLGGLFLFTAASLACALAPSLAWLVVARTLQGFGAGGLMSVNGALVRLTYPVEQARPRHRPQLAGRRDRVGRRAVDRGAGAVGGVVAVAVRHQPADRRRRHRARPEGAAEESRPPRRRRPAVADRRDDERADVRAARARCRRARHAARRNQLAAASRRGRAAARGGCGRRRALHAAATAPGRAALSARPAAHPRVRAVDVHLDRRVRGAVARLRRRCPSCCSKRTAARMP